MNNQNSGRHIFFYRLVAVLLLGIVASLAVSLDNALKEREAAIAEAHSAATPKNNAPRAAAPGQQSRSVEIKNLEPLIEQINNSSEKEDERLILFQAPFGDMRLISLGVRQKIPLHFHRVSGEAFLPIYGEHEAMIAAEKGGKQYVKKIKPGLSEILFFNPYETHGWANASASSSAIVIGFSSPYKETNNYVDLDDDREIWGGAPETFDSKKMVEEFLKSKKESEIRRLPGMGGTLSAIAVASEISLEKSSGPNAIWVVSGQGKLTAQGEHRLAANHLAIIPESTPVRLSADRDNPLVALLYQPEYVEVSEIVTQGKKLYSQYDEELLIRDFIRDRRGGVFLDVGSADYRFMSTTYYLEEKLGWSGVAVDALSEYAKGYLEHRPLTKFFNYLITDKPRGEQKFYRAPFSLVVSSASKVVAKDQQRFYKGKDEIEEIDVPSITLNDLLKQQGIEKIDFMSMDIEEHEPEGLAGFDIDRYHPQLVCIEAHKSVADAIYKYFVAHNYMRIEKYHRFDRYNWYFTPRNNSSQDAR